MRLEPGHPRQEAEEYAALYVLGALPADESESFKRHLDLGCAQCRDEIRAMEQTAAHLGFDSARVPPPALRDRVLQGIPVRNPAPDPTPARDSAANGTGRIDAAPGRSTVRADQLPWETTPFPGITVRRLHVDPVGRRMTVLVRMEAGASYVPHRHNGPEESFVLEGTVTSDGQTFSPGDYHRAEAGSLHGVQTTENGCMLLIMSCLDDELLVGTV